MCTVNLTTQKFFFVQIYLEIVLMHSTPVSQKVKIYNFNINASGRIRKIQVFCDLETDGGGWLVKYKAEK